MQNNLTTVTLVTSDEWEGLFINGKLDVEGHSVRLEITLELLQQLGLIKYERLHANEDNLETYGSFAETLDENRAEGIIE